MRGRWRRRVAALLVVLALLWSLAAWYDRPPALPGRWLAAARLEPYEAKVAGLRLRYVRTGEGPAVVLVHGFASSLYTWKDVIPLLAEDHDVVALDLPGFGWSEQPRDLSFDDFPTAVLGIMDTLGLARASLVGNSLGGAACALVAGLHPDRVDALVLVDSAGFNLGEADRPRLVRFALSPYGRVLELLPLRRLAVELGLRQVFYDRSLVTDERVAEYLAPMLRPGAMESIRALGSGPGRDPALFEQALAGIEAPTLVVWGLHDRWIPLRDADRFEAAIRGARKAVIADAGHVPQEERPAEVAALIRSIVP